MVTRLTYRRAEFVYEGARLAAIAAKAPIIPAQWAEREERFQMQFLKVIDQQMGDMRSESPEELHGSWMQAYVEMGWKYGEVYDREAKTHPDMVPYAKLGQLERDKDAVFVALCAIARQWIYGDDDECETVEPDRFATEDEIPARERARNRLRDRLDAVHAKIRNVTEADVLAVLNVDVDMTPVSELTQARIDAARDAAWQHIQEANEDGWKYVAEDGWENPAHDAAIDRLIRFERAEAVAQTCACRGSDEAVRVQHCQHKAELLAAIEDIEGAG